MRIGRLLLLVLAGMLVAGTAMSAVYKGRRVDGHWFKGRAINSTFGAYECEVKFDGDRGFVRVPSAGLQIVVFLDEEVILDPHDITAYDPRRGVYWTLNQYVLV